MHRLIASLLGLLLAAGACTLASADVLQLKDGRILRGERVNETEYVLEFRTQVDGEWKTISYWRSEIASFFPEDGNQADTIVRPPVTTPDRPPTSNDAGNDEEAASTGTGPVVFVPLLGQVGGLIKQSVEGTFDAEVLEKCFEKAIEEGAGAVVLEIDSPGGFVIEMEAICDKIIEYRERLRIVSWPKDAMSAAAIISLVCPEMIVQPGARVGAAVIIHSKEGEEGPTAVEAKFASPHHARQKQYMEAVGRPYAVVAAMTIQEAELWWSEEHGFVTDPPTAEGFERIDGASTVLTLTAKDAVRLGVALAEAKTREAIIESLDLGGRDPVDLAITVAQYNDGVDRRIRILIESFSQYFMALSGLHEAIGELQFTGARGDPASIAQLKREIRSLFNDARTAARRMRQVDRSLITRRAAVPDVLLDVLDDDDEVLAAVQRIVNATRGNLAEARRGVASLLDRWNELLEPDE